MQMKISDCTVCGSTAEVVYLDDKGRRTLYGVECDNGHYVPAVFGTKNRAIQAWNECQRFVERCSPSEDDLK